MKEKQENLCRKCRNSGSKLFLKGARCLTPKCAALKRNYKTGQQGQKRHKRPNEYGIQLAEKQKAKSIYGMREQQFKRLFETASQTKSATGAKLLQLLETRIDNIVYRLGLAKSRRHAKQMVTHRKIMLDGKKVDIPSINLGIGQTVSPVNAKGIKIDSANLPKWLEFNRKTLTGRLKTIPRREDLPPEINEELIVEYYSR